MVFYNGWKHHHGIQYLSLEAPNGLRMYLYGPRSYKDSDLGLLRDSEINGKLFHLQSENINQYCAYGDGIFPLRSHIWSRNINSIDPLEHIEKTIMTRIRVVNEWGYGVTKNLFPFVKQKYAQKIRQNPSVINNYAVTTLLGNAFLCLNEGQTSKYFNCPPHLFDYFQVL